VLHYQECCCQLLSSCENCTLACPACTVIVGLAGLSHNYEDCLWSPLLLPPFSLPPHPAALRAGNRIPPDQVGKFKERKQILDQVVAKDAEQMKRTCIVRTCSYLSVISGSLHLHSGGLVTRVSSSCVHVHVPVSTIP